jgi:hypothetical protein
MTMNQPDAYMELDLGIGGKMTNKIIVSTPKNVPNVGWSVTRCNGVTLSVMDEARTVIFQHTFSGITTSSPVSFEFVIPNV